MLCLILKNNILLFVQVATFQLALATDGSTTVFIFNYIESPPYSEVSRLHIRLETKMDQIGKFCFK